MSPPAEYIEAASWRRWLPLALLLLGWVAMFGPVYFGLAQTIWASDANGHGPIILTVGAWLLWCKRDALTAMP